MRRYLLIKWPWCPRYRLRYSLRLRADHALRRQPRVAAPQRAGLQPHGGFQLATTARGATRKRRSRFPFRDHTHAALPLSEPCRSPRPFSATLGIVGKGADRQEEESVNGPTNPSARDRSLVGGRPLTSLRGRRLSAGRAPLGGQGKTAPGVAGRPG